MIAIDCLMNHDKARSVDNTFAEPQARIAAEWSRCTTLLHAHAKVFRRQALPRHLSKRHCQGLARHEPPKNSLGVLCAVFCDEAWPVAVSRQRQSRNSRSGTQQFACEKHDDTQCKACLFCYQTCLHTHGTLVRQVELIP